MIFPRRKIMEVMATRLFRIFHTNAKWG